MKIFQKAENMKWKKGGKNPEKSEDPTYSHKQYQLDKTKRSNVFLKKIYQDRMKYISGWKRLKNNHKNDFNKSPHKGIL